MMKFKVIEGNNWIVGQATEREVTFKELQKLMNYKKETCCETIYNVATIKKMTKDEMVVRIETRIIKY